MTALCVVGHRRDIEFDSHSGREVAHKIHVAAVVLFEAADPD
jgi:hypothetical protein